MSLNIYANKKLGTTKDLAVVKEYSTTEINTGNKWIDGKPIYRKVISINSPNSPGWTEIATNTSNIDSFVKIDAKLLNSVGTPILIPWYFGTGEYVMGSLYANGNYIINVTSQFINRPIKIIVEYTKTTD